MQNISKNIFKYFKIQYSLHFGNRRNRRNRHTTYTILCTYEAYTWLLSLCRVVDKQNCAKKVARTETFKKMTDGGTNRYRVIAAIAIDIRDYGSKYRKA